MPIKTTVFSVEARVKFPEGSEPKYDWYGAITLKLNTLALSPAFCAKVQMLVTEELAKNADRLASMTSSATLEEWETKDEEQAKLREDARQLVEGLWDDSEVTDIRATIIATEQAKQYGKLSGEKLEFVNERLEAHGIEPLTRSEFDA